MRDPCKVKIIYDDADGRRREKPFELNLLESVPVEVAKICELFSIDNSNNYTLVLKGAFQDEDGDVVASEEVHESMFYLSDDQFNRQVELNEGDELFLMLKPSYVASRCITNLKEKSEGIDTSIRELRRMLMVEVDVAEEFIAQGGIPALVQFSAHASGPLQSYGLLAMKSCLTYVSAIDALADSQQVVEDLYSILCNTNSNSNSNGNISIEINTEDNITPEDLSTISYRSQLQQHASSPSNRSHSPHVSRLRAATLVSFVKNSPSSRRNTLRSLSPMRFSSYSTTSGGANSSGNLYEAAANAETTTEDTNDLQNDIRTLFGKCEKVAERLRSEVHKAESRLEEVLLNSFLELASDRLPESYLRYQISRTTTTPK
eukprot:GEZU01017672.1.p1 GENE.GEZU01017672.1~~GEZU01017672.1.p1  ORF type:complete len:375 (-),score=48.09 GEZU01017672.1:55-1179(-)